MLYAPNSPIVLAYAFSDLVLFYERMDGAPREITLAFDAEIVERRCSFRVEIAREGIRLDARDPVNANIIQVVVAQPGYCLQRSLIGHVGSPFSAGPFLAGDCGHEGTDDGPKCSNRRCCFVDTNICHWSLPCSKSRDQSLIRHTECPEASEKFP